MLGLCCLPLLCPQLGVCVIVHVAANYLWTLLVTSQSRPVPWWASSGLSGRHALQAQSSRNFSSLSVIALSEGFPQKGAKKSQPGSPSWVGRCGGGKGCIGSCESRNSPCFMHHLETYFPLTPRAFKRAQRVGFQSSVLLLNLTLPVPIRACLLGNDSHRGSRFKFYLLTWTKGSLFPAPEATTLG